MCVGQTWYLAADMQMFVISPIFFFIAYRYKYCILYLFNMCFLYPCKSQHAAIDNDFIPYCQWCFRILRLGCVIPHLSIGL